MILRWVMVAELLEAERLRAAGIDCEVLVMDVLFSDAQCDRVVEQGLTMAVYTEEAALALDAAGRRQGRIAQVFVKVDTGLRRVGVRHDLAPDLIERIAEMPNIRVAGVFSSFMQHPDRDREILDLTGTDARAGDEVEVFARQGANSLRAMAEAAGWRVYSLMNHLSPELPRVFHRGGEPVALREPGVG